MKISFGGWYQRTTLHLTEVYDFLAKGTSKLAFDETKLRELRDKLNLKSVTHEVGYLEYIRAVTRDGIEIRYYEDGLYIFELKSNDIDNCVKLMKDYFNDFFNPAISYIFSLGAPTPKILSNIKTEHPIVITKYETDPQQFLVPPKFGEVYSKLTSRDITVYKTKDYIFIVGLPSKKNSIEIIVEMQIFFREFKDQLHKYLNIHRKIWEEISEIKERKYLKGKQVQFYRSRLESYKKSIDLINSRINQMSAYAHTRASLAKNLSVESHLIELFQYRFEDLFNTLVYIKEIWQMTANYVNSAISVLVEVANRLSVSGIRSIQVLAAIGVVTTVITYLTRDTLPTISKLGIYYFVGLVAAVWAIDYIIKLYSKNKIYELKFTEAEKEI